MDDVSLVTVGHQGIVLPKCFDLYRGPTEHYIEWGVPLHRAALEGDWKTAERILQQQPNLATAYIDALRDNVLHIAAGTNKSSYFIRELVVKYMTREDLALPSSNGTTPLGFIAQSGDNVEVAELMVRKNDRLPLMRNPYGVPLTVATDWDHPRMARFLLSVTDLQQLTRSDLVTLLSNAICAKMYDIALEIVDKFPDLALYKDAEGRHILQLLAEKRLHTHSTQAGSSTKRTSSKYDARLQNEYTKDEGLDLVLVDKLWGKILRDGTLRDRAYFSGAIFNAARMGDVDFIAKLIGNSPELIWTRDSKGRDIFGIAILNRRVEVFNLIYEIHGWKGLSLMHVDTHGNNALHLAAMSPPDESLNAVSGAALQMQRELLWYKEVENLITAQCTTVANDRGSTPPSLFSQTHREMRKDGEKWMKTTANSCSLVAALVATVTFAAALTLPGGNDQSKGTPIFQSDPIFVTFAIADALSLFSSSLAILMFLGILTSRYAEEDFLKYLPLRLLIGLSTLFLSIAFMMVAFASTFFIIFKARLPFIPIPAVVLIFATIPVAIFAFEQSPLLINIYRSTYEAKYIFRNSHRICREKKNGGNNLFLKRLSLKCLGKDH